MQPGQPAMQPQPMQQPPVQNTAAQLFGGIDHAKTSFDSNYMRPGHYILRIDNIKASANQKGEPFLATEMTVLHCISDLEATQHALHPHLPGETVTDMKMKKHQSFLPNVRAQIAGMEGMSIEELQQQLGREGKSVEQYMIDVCGPNQPYAGMFVEIHARQIMTQRGTPFTKISYKREVRPSELPGFLSPEQIQKFFPGDMLQQLIGHEQSIHGNAADPMVQPTQQQQPAQPQYQPPTPGQPG